MNLVAQILMDNVGAVGGGFVSGNVEGLAAVHEGIKNMIKKEIIFMWSF